MRLQTCTNAPRTGFGNGNPVKPDSGTGTQRKRNREREPSKTGIGNGDPVKPESGTKTQENRNSAYGTVYLSTQGPSTGTLVEDHIEARHSSSSPSCAFFYVV